MGAWGTGLYQDDVACDIKAEYLNKLRVGKSNIEATQEMIEENYYLIQDYEEGPIFWFALADTQWKYGRLLPEIKKQTLKFIKKGTDLKRWQDNSKQYLKREKVLDDLKERLNSPQPLEKKVSKLTLHRTFWNPGDILLYQLTSEYVKNEKWYKKYILLEIVGKVHIGVVDQYYEEYDVAKVYNWIGEGSITEKRIKELDYLQTVIEFLQRPSEIQDAMIILDFTRRDIKKMNITLLYNNEEYDSKFDYILDSCHKGYYNIKNADIGLIGLLKRSYNQDKQIDETNK